MLGNLHDWNPAADRVADDALPEIDRYALDALQRLIGRVTRAYENYDYHLLYHDIHNYCVIDLSAFYLDVLKDRLYTAAPASVERRSAQTVLYEIAVVLAKIIAPVMPHTAEEIWDHLPKTGGEPESVHLARWPEAESRYLDGDLAARWERLRRVRDQVSKTLEEARNRKEIGTSLEARVELYATPELGEFLRGYLSELPRVFIVSQVELLEGAPATAGGAALGDSPDLLQVDVRRARGGKCRRCWVYSEELGRVPDHPELCPRCAGVVAGR